MNFPGAAADCCEIVEKKHQLEMNANLPGFARLLRNKPSLPCAETRGDAGGPLVSQSFREIETGAFAAYRIRNAKPTKVYKG